MSLLTLPGTIPGLLRRGSPVVGWLGQRAVICGLTDDGHALVGCYDPPEFVEVIARVRVVMLALDLSDPTGRAHAAWWLAAALGKTVTGGALWVAYGGSTRLASFRPPVGWALQYDAGQEWFSRGTGWAQRVDPLAALDSADPRLLPDGSRWVDAEALRLVCLHVAGVSA